MVETIITKSIETREQIAARLERTSFDEGERAVMASALAQIHERPSLDCLSEMARQVRRGVAGKGNTFSLGTTDHRETLLQAEAVAVGIDKDVAAGIIRASFDRARRELDAELEAEPSRVANRALVAEIQADQSLEGVRSAVFRAIKKGALSPDQIDRRSVLRAAGIDEYPPAHDAQGRAALDDAQRAIEQGVQTALDDWSEVDTADTAAIRSCPVIGQIQAAVSDISADFGYVDAGLLERLMAPAILEAESIVIVPENAIDTAIENEIATIRQSATPLRALLAATNRVARVGTRIDERTFRILCRAFSEEPSPPLTAIVPADALSVSAKTEPTAEQEAPQGRNLLEPRQRHEPAPDFSPVDGWAPSSKTETLRPDENGVIHAGVVPGHGRAFGGNRPTAPAAKLADASGSRPIGKRAMRAHERLAERRGTKGE